MGEEGPLLNLLSLLLWVKKMHVFILKKGKYNVHFNDPLIHFLMYEDCIHTSHVCIFSTFRVDHSPPSWKVTPEHPPLRNVRPADPTSQSKADRCQSKAAHSSASLSQGLLQPLSGKVGVKAFQKKQTHCLAEDQFTKVGTFVFLEHS